MKTKQRGDWYQHLRYLPHNIIGHPLMAIFQLFGIWGASTWIHEVTLPKSAKETGEKT